MASADTNRGAEPLIKARNLDKRYNRGGEEIHVLRGLSLDVKRGEFIAFMGPSGSGKTTLLNILGGLDQPSTGSVLVDGVDITTKSRKALAEWRARHVGLVFQAYNLIPVLTAAQNVELPLLLTSLDKANRRKRIEAALRIVGLKDRMNHFPRQLSGGQEQRAAIARAIVSDPEMLLCDEPTGDLDRTAADNVLELLTLLATDRGTTILMVTHDQRAADRAHRQLHLDKGVLVDAPESALQEARP
jgi:putative ABC transport system ATP-binding protein